MMSKLDVILFILLIHGILHQVFSFKLVNRILPSFAISSDSLTDATTEVSKSSVTSVSRVPTVNTKAFDISISNPFGPIVKNIESCRQELISIVNGSLEMETNFYHCRIEYLSKVLQANFIPIQTIPFLNLAMQGEWRFRYSNTLIPQKDNDL